MTLDTLVIRRLPVALSKEDLEDFLMHIGAVQVNIHRSKVKKFSYAYVRFKNEKVAHEALFQLHQKEVFNTRLIVEFASDNIISDDFQKLIGKEGQIIEENRKLNTTREIFLNNLNNWTIGLNLSLPPPYHLKYRYPAPNSITLLNIANMLCRDVKFYVQVLHLMNKMNLPSPFESSFPVAENDNFNSFLIYILENYINEDKLNKAENQAENDSEKESELESENEGTPVKYGSVPMKRKKSLTNEKLVKKKRLLRATFGITPKCSRTPVEDVFEKIERDNRSTKIRVKISGEMPIHECSQTGSLSERTTEGFGAMYPPKKAERKEEKEEKLITEGETLVEEGYITLEELNANRIPEKEWKILPNFKNYQPGTPSCRLYIKNLSKQVVASDLNFIYSRYLVKDSDEQGTMFDVRLMQEGRMKGQAFVTMQSVKQAELALKETNGYVLKNKPMIVQFARSAVTKTNDANRS